MHKLSFSTYPSALNPIEKLKRTALAPFHAHAAGIVSRMYSTHLPGHQIQGPQINDLLSTELHDRVIDTTTDFIFLLFPEKRKPLTIDNAFYKKLSQTTKDIYDKPCLPLWDSQTCSLMPPESSSEKDLADWLNLISKVMGDSCGKSSTHIWSNRCQNTPVAGSHIKRKPDLILIDRSYNEQLLNQYIDTNWCFIKSFCEVTAEK